MLQRPGANISKDPRAVHRFERVDLQVEVLLVGGYAGVTDQVTGAEPTTHRAMLSEVSDVYAVRRCDLRQSFATRRARGVGALSRRVLASQK
jgi:hypothetical protein